LNGRKVVEKLARTGKEIGDRPTLVPVVGSPRTYHWQRAAAWRRREIPTLDSIAGFQSEDGQSHRGISSRASKSFLGGKPSMTDTTLDRSVEVDIQIRKLELA
jgi:hypothetical protein